MYVQPGAVKLVLWRHLMHEIQVHSVMPENQFHCTRLYVYDIKSFWKEETQREKVNGDKCLERKQPLCFLLDLPVVAQVAAAGEFREMLPAGEMRSAVTASPR